MFDLLLVLCESFLEKKQQHLKGVRPMSTEQLKAMDRRFFEQVWSQGKLEVLDELMAATFVDHDENPNATDTLEGLKHAKHTIMEYRSAFPDVHFMVEEQIAEGDMVVTRWTAHGTHKGIFRGIPPTGKQAMTTGISITRVVSGKFIEGWISYDALGLLQQLGVVPPPA